MPYEDLPGAYWAVLGPGVDLRRTDYDIPRPRSRFVHDFVLSRMPASEATAYFERLAEERESADQ